MKHLFVAVGLVLASTQFSQSFAAEHADLSKEEAQPGAPVVGELQPDAPAVIEGALMRTPALTLRDHVIDAFDDYEDGAPLPDCLEILTKCDFSDDKIDEVYLERMEAAVLAMNFDAPQFVLQLLEFNILSPLVPFTTRVLSLTLAHCSGYANNTWMLKNLTHLNEFFIENADKVTTTPLADILSLVAFNCEKGEKAEGERIWRAHWQRLALEVRYPEWAIFAILCERLDVVIPQTDIIKLVVDYAGLKFSQSLAFTAPWFNKITSHSYREITKARELRLPMHERTKRAQAHAEIEASFAPHWVPQQGAKPMSSDFN